MDIVIRPETSNDFAAVRELLISAFPTDAESRLVDALRANGKAVISLVADVNGQVIGHILFSPVTTSPHSDPTGLGLAPVAVTPLHQMHGVGSALIREGLRRCPCDYVIVLGNPKYYSRFGFQKASQFGLQNEYRVDDAFMRYAPEFGNLGL